MASETAGFGGGFGETVYGTTSGGVPATLGERSAASAMKLEPDPDAYAIGGWMTDHPGLLHPLFPAKRGGKRKSGG